MPQVIITGALFPNVLIGEADRILQLIRQRGFGIGQVQQQLVIAGRHVSLQRIIQRLRLTGQP